MSEPIRVSNSEIQMWLKCRRRWYLSYYEKWRPRDPVVTGALALGSRVHAALEVYYKGHGPLLEQYDLLMCRVTIEFDRKVVDELTGASGSAE